MERLPAMTLVVCALAATLAGQAPVLDAAVIARLREETTLRSQVYEHVWWLSEVFGPRVTGTPAFAQASEWAMQKFREWGLANVHQERWAFGQGWTINRFSATMLEPQPAVLIGAPRNYSPATVGPVVGEVVTVRIDSEADFANYAGRLRGKIVVMQPARAVRMLEGPVILRMDDGPWWNEASTPVEPAPVAAPSAAAAAAAKARQQLAAATQRFLVDEGIGALLERGSDDDLVGRRQRPLVGDAAHRRRHDLPDQRRQPQSEGGAAGAVGDPRRGALQPPRPAPRAQGAGADGGLDPDDVPS